MGNDKKSDAGDAPYQNEQQDFYFILFFSEIHIPVTQLLMWKTIFTHNVTQPFTNTNGNNPNSILSHNFILFF